jgi:mono/diheme cytochrome c family protein
MSRWINTAVLAVAVSTLTCAPLGAQQTPADPPPGPGLELIQRSCIGCHDIYMITTKRKTPDEWAATVALMGDRGAEVTPEEMQVIAEYLSQNFSKAAAPATSK